MLAASWAMDYFDTYLKGMKFKLFTDHKPLETLRKIHYKTFYCLQEQMNIFNFTVNYKKGQWIFSVKMCAKQLMCLIPSCQTYKKKIQPAKLSMISFKTWTIQKPIKNRSSQPKLMTISSNKLKNVSFKMISCGFDATSWRKHLVLFVPQVLRNALIKEAHGQLLTGQDGI
jgi:hypothetical protein